uniref:Ubiquinone biosynthesis protein n=1 Tax=Crithidia acanthocephali TaxID=59798 RepID=T1YRN4_9TRYP|nr:ubiquinone biosynthesis protein [Crithidia acanthocephali]
MTLRLFRSRLAKAAAVAVGLPVVGAGGLTLYVSYRKRTRPHVRILKPLVDESGNLILEGQIIASPSRTAVCWRIVQLALIFLPVAALYLIMSLRKAWYDRWLEMLLAAVQRAGPVFVKIGQWSCTREDLFAPEFRRVFKRLYNEVDIHAYEDTLRILGEELHADPFTVFDTIEPKTVGSGSIGQVHLAKLRNSNRKVVVKVMHPQIIETIVLDFNILNNLAKRVDAHFPSLDRYRLPQLSLAFSSHLAAQLDFRVEAQNLEQFRENFKSEHYVDFPEPLMSTQRMLVETFCDGQPANPEFLASLPPHARDVLANKGLNTWCKMLLRDNFIHGDMHPGNILIDCSDQHEPKVTMIDVGLCQQLTDHEGEVTHELMESFVRWNPVQCADSLLAMSDHQEYADPELFRNDLSNLFKHFRPSRNDENAVTNILQSIFESIRVNNVQMDPPYVSLLFAVLVLESFIMNLNPEFNMVRHTAPWLVSEGHLSKGVIKNVIKTKIDNLKRDYGILTGRMEDSMREDYEANKNIRMSSW